MRSAYFWGSVSVPLVILVFRLLLRKSRRNSIENLPGPESKSWIAGHMGDLVRPESAGNLEHSWAKTYGVAVNIKAFFGNDMLLIADPKAMQYILNTSGYNYPKPRQNRLLNMMVAGRGLIWAEGSQHARQRRIMAPAFSYSSLKVFLPLFNRTAQQTVTKWTNLISQGGDISSVINIPGWLSRMTLDALGEAALDHSFNAIDEESDNALAREYRNLFVDIFYQRSDARIVMEWMSGSLPEFLHPLVRKIPTNAMGRLNKYMDVARGVAKSIVDGQVKSHAAGMEGGRGVMSLLVKANLSEDPKRQMTEDEILSQLTTMMIAGHETSGNTLTWALYEFSRNISFQNKVRAEIKAARSRAVADGRSELTIADLDSMDYLLAAMKETLRCHPILPAILRRAGRDDHIPLSVPQTTRTGESITEVSIQKDQLVLISISVYNRLKHVWGEDADIWRPERFLEGDGKNQKINVGLVANIATFSSGIRGCIGWRFAMIEMQAILINLLENFEFTPAPGNLEIVKSATGIISPMVKGSEILGVQLPLTVTALS